MNRIPRPDVGQAAAKPALIVFCREPVPGQVKTRLQERLGANAASALADSFILDALERARRVIDGNLVIAAGGRGDARSSPYFLRLARRFEALLIDQGGGGLGTRMARALAPFADHGAVLIGTDTPSLPDALLERSLALVDQVEAVVAPSLDGGYYLIGVRRRVPDIFSRVRWGTAHVLARTVARLKQLRVNYAIGPAWYDIDRWGDLALLVKHLEMLGSLKVPSSRKSVLAGRPTAEIKWRRIASSMKATPNDMPCPHTLATLKRLGLMNQAR